MERIDSSVGARRLFRVAATRRIEADAAAALEPHTLMRRAGLATARLALALAPHARRVWIAAGPGNNGGDGLEAAFVLRQAGKDVAVMLHGVDRHLPADAQMSLERARQAGVLLEQPWDAQPSTDLAIDALLGIGASRAPEGQMADTVRRLNLFSGTVLALDVPSGLDADTGRPWGDACVVAHHTLALLTLKPGLFTGAGRDHAGAIWLDTLGSDEAAEASEAPRPDAELVGRAAPPCAVQRRRHAAHKGTFGDVAVVGGAEGMVGAAMLAAHAAHAAGAGRVYVALLASPAAAALHDPTRPELMFRPGWHERAPEVLRAATVVCGCGGGEAVAATLPALLEGAGRLVLDADALNAIAADGGLQAGLHDRASRQSPTILTPHPLEAARLLGCSTADVQADRLRAAREIADTWSCVVVLKGSGTVISAPGRAPAIAASGNAALASAGTGDVLAGWLGGLWAQEPVPEAAGRNEGAHDEAAGPSGFDTAVRAVVEHGMAAEPEAPGALRAGDVIERLYRGLRSRPMSLTSA